MRGEDDGEAPLEAVLQAFGAVAHRIVRPCVDVARLAGVVVLPRDEVTVGAGVDDFGVARIGCDPAALAAAHVIPVAVRDGAGGGAGRDANGAVVLLRAVGVIGEVLVERDAIELRGGLVLDGRPRFAAILGDGRAAVVGLDHALRIFGGDPEVVVVAVGRGEGGEGASPIGRAVGADVQGVDDIGIPGVGKDVGEVPGALAEVVFLIHARPVFTGVIGAEEAAIGGFDHGPDTVRIGGGDGHGDAALHAAGQPGRMGDIGPRVAAIGGFPETAARAAAVEAPGFAADLPERGVDGAGVGGIHREVHGAGLGAFGQDLFPGCATVRGTVDAAFRIRPPEVAEGGHVDHVRILRMHAHRADVIGLLEADVLPGAPAIHRLINTVAVRGVAAHAGLAHACVDHVGIGLRDFDGADGGGFELPVGDGTPGQAGIGGFPDAAADGTEVVGARIGGHAGNRDGAASAEGADQPEFEVFQKVSLLCERRGKED